METCDISNIHQGATGWNLSSVFHLSMVGFTVLHIIQRHYIWWSAPFQIVNPKVMFSYIKGKLGFPCKKFDLRLPVLTIFGGSAI